MIFVGDVAVPPGLAPTRPAHLRRLSDILVANLEGAITNDVGKAAKPLGLFNDPDVIPYLQSLNVKVVSLANNHIMDIDNSLDSTVVALQEAGIASCGAGENRIQAAKPAVIYDGGRERVFLAFGWEPIKCKAATQDRPGVNPLRPSHVLNLVRQVRAKYRASTLTVLVHWNYELEIYPQPMHRSLAFAVIDAGADAVIGCHSHCVQGIEVYKNSPIAYSLGNWFIPHGYFFGGSLRYPEFSQRQLAFQWRPETGEMVCHWFDYRPSDHQLSWVRSSPVEEDPDIARYTPFRGMGHAEYASWFRRHRRKRFLLPVYTRYEHTFVNSFKDKWVCFRGYLIDTLLALKLKHGPR